MTSLPVHHVEEAVLLDYAAGALPASVSLVVATHLALCPACRRALGALESLGGAAIEALEPAALNRDSISNLLRRLDDAPAPAAPAPRPPSHGIPEPLNSLLGKRLDALDWTGVGGVEIHPIRFPGDTRKTYLMRIAGGAKMPRHTHRGAEMTLVLQGGFSDAYGAYARGDFSFMDETRSHSPVADPEGCICLINTENPLRMGGLISGLVAKWFGV